jgi:hypothetical protein
MAITPYLLYQTAGAAVAWLAKAFGRRPSGTAHQDDAGRVTHAELKFGNALLLLGSPGVDFKNPTALGHATHNLRRRGPRTRAPDEGGPARQVEGQRQRRGAPSDQASASLSQPGGEDVERTLVEGDGDRRAYLGDAQGVNVANWLPGTDSNRRPTD